MEMYADCSNPALHGFWFHLKNQSILKENKSQSVKVKPVVVLKDSW